MTQLKTLYRIECTPDDLDILTDALGHRLDLQAENPNAQPIDRRQLARSERLLEFLIAMRHGKSRLPGVSP